MGVTVALFVLGRMRMQQILQFGSNGKQNNKKGTDVPHVTRRFLENGNQLSENHQSIKQFTYCDAASYKGFEENCLPFP
jgi:hypothetical protein